MRVLGIDPGSNITGVGIVEREGTRLRPVYAGIIKTKRGAPLERRLLTIHKGVSEAIEEHRPSAVAVEDIFMAKFPNAALKLGHARGVALLAAANADLEVFAYPPTVVKRSVVGKGAGSKAQVAQMVGAILGLKELPEVDATDALAVAITHSLASRMPKPTKRRR